MQGIHYYFLVSKKNTEDFFFGRSCFTRNQNEQDFTIGHTSYTILRKVKIDLRGQKKPIVQIRINDNLNKEQKNHPMFKIS